MAPAGITLPDATPSFYSVFPFVTLTFPNAGRRAAARRINGCGRAADCDTGRLEPGENKGMQHHFGALAAFAAALCAGQSSGEQPQFLWEGDVADFCILTIHGTAVQSREADGTPASHERHRFRAKLPDTNQTLSLQMLHGRGVARFLSQPTLNNGYTAVIRIDDPQPGS